MIICLLGLLFRKTFWWIKWRIHIWKTTNSLRYLFPLSFPLGIVPMTLLIWIHEKNNVCVLLTCLHVVITVLHMNLLLKGLQSELMRLQEHSQQVLLRYTLNMTERIISVEYSNALSCFSLVSLLSLTGLTGTTAVSRAFYEGGGSSPTITLYMQRSRTFSR